MTNCALILMCYWLVSLWIYHGSGTQAKAEEKEEEWQPDSPTIATSAFVVPPGRFQLETTATIGKARGGNGLSVTAPNFLLRYGFYRNFEFRVSGPGLIREQGETNFGDVDLAIKYHLLDEGKWTPAIGLIPQVTLPTASDNAGSGSVEPRFFLAFDKDLPLGFGVEWNLGAGYIDNQGSGRFFQVLYAVVLSRDLTKSLSAYAEVYGVSKVQPGEGGSVATDFGLLFRLSKNIFIYLGADFGIANANEQNALTGFAFRL
jgi:outer membrane putative beta-barrel porin/alpha-amylase